MGEASTLIKMVVALGIFFLLAGMLYSGAESGWTNFQSAVRNSPTFNNPFDSTTVTYTFGWESGGTGYETRVRARGAAHGCSSSAYWSCLVDPNDADGNLSYLEINDDDAGDAEFLSLNVTGLPSAGEVRSGSLSVWCRANETADVPFNVVVHEWIPNTGGSGNSYLDSLAFQYFCVPGYTFRLVVAHLTADIIRNLNANANPPNLQLWVSGFHGKSWHTTKLVLTIEIAASGCTGTDFFSNIGCSISNFLATGANILAFLINGLIFLGQVLLYLAGIVNAFFGMLNFLFAIPDAPAIIQSIISVAVIGMIAWIAFVFIRTVRGSGAVG